MARALQTFLLANNMLRQARTLPARVPENTCDWCQATLAARWAALRSNCLCHRIGMCGDASWTVQAISMPVPACGMLGMHAAHYLCMLPHACAVAAPSQLCTCTLLPFSEGMADDYPPDCSQDIV